MLVFYEFLFFSISSDVQIPSISPPLLLKSIFSLSTFEFLPEMHDDLSASETNYQWNLSAYKTMHIGTSKIPVYLKYYSFLQRHLCVLLRA